MTTFCSCPQYPVCGKCGLCTGCKKPLPRFAKSGVPYEDCTTCFRVRNDWERHLAMRRAMQAAFARG